MKTPIVNEYFLKIVWTKGYIAFAIDKSYKDITIPLTTFYFWPREDGWKLLKQELDNKPWINEKDKIQILNLASNIINIWIKNIQGKIGTIYNLKFKVIGQ